MQNILIFFFNFEKEMFAFKKISIILSKSEYFKVKY